MNLAKDAKNDEFYTLYEDIEKEISNYDLAGKAIYCNCDDVSFSNFFKFFMDKVDEVRFKRVIFSGLNVKYFTIIDNVEGILSVERREMVGNGDFRSDECVEMLKASDVVVTNPPFSLFREYVSQLVKYDKKFVVVGNYNAVTYKEIFKLIKQNKLWLGLNGVKKFRKPNGEFQKFGNVNWFTNISAGRITPKLVLTKCYNHEDYQKYDNYDAIEVSKVKDIPVDYDGAMGVPITFLKKYNPEQFEIVGLLDDKREKSDGLIHGTPTYLDEKHKKCVGAVLNNKAKYSRIIIKHKK